MPPVPRLQLSSDFRKAVRADSRGIVRLATLAGFPAYTALTRLLTRPRVPGTALNMARVRELATAINFDGPVFRGQ